MSDVTQGQDAPSDNELFRDVTDAVTLEKFENPEPPKVPDEKPVEKPAEKIEDRKDEAIPAFRLREEAEARRRVEQERDDLRARLERLERQAPRQPQQKEPPAKIDLFENPSGFVRQEIDPMLEEFRNELQRTREAMSLDNAIARHGAEKVDAARKALEQGMARNDPDAWSTYNRAMH